MRNKRSKSVPILNYLFINFFFNLNMSSFLIFRILSSIHNQPQTRAFYRLSNQRLRHFLPLVAPGNFLCSTQPSLPLMLLENFKIAMIENLSVSKKIKSSKFKQFPEKIQSSKFSEFPEKNSNFKIIRIFKKRKLLRKNLEVREKLKLTKL